jgi:hypothetical protein
MLPLEPGSLDSEWWPREVEGRPLSVRERHRDFVQQLDETYRRLQRQEPSATNFPRPPESGTASATSAARGRQAGLIRQILREVERRRARRTSTQATGPPSRRRRVTTPSHTSRP